MRRINIDNEGIVKVILILAGAACICTGHEDAGILLIFIGLVFA